MIKRHERDLVFARLQSEMSFLAKPNMPAEEVNNKPKRRLLDFDESDEESNEEDPMKAELKYVKKCFSLFHSYLTGSKMSLPWTRTRTPLVCGRPRD